ncbi:hypothetical protein BG015_001897 [Linnemannia schmuckeri]|uniref:Kelch repeat-containing protein n=1 Tax=Linnemannia schmuckeri TaxID=64567 RepID=A0A9P5S5Q9_9FUNG|nr:hypothetical protein BG015_001897 [Linnemannia schmuckeri]
MTGSRNYQGGGRETRSVESPESAREEDANLQPTDVGSGGAVETAAVATAITACLISSTTFAQSTAPVPVAFGGYTSDGEKTLYIRGGSPTGNVNDSTNQFFALDLQTSWSTSNPAWKSLTSTTGPAMPVTVYNSLAMTGPNKIIEWSISPGLIIFDLASSSVTPILNLNATRQYGLTIAVDPTTTADTGTGAAYVPCGYSAGLEMARLVSKDNVNVVKTVPMPTTGVMQKIGFYSFVWSSARSSFLLFGGYTEDNPPVCNNQMWEYKSEVWGPLTMKNTPYTDVVEHCMVPAMNGTKMVMFGGWRAMDYKPISGIHIFDTTTMEWKAGTAAPAQEARRSMACTVSGDYFIAWGGTNGTVMGPKPLVYNMKTDQWVDQFLALGDSGGATTGGTNTGAIAGGAGGAVVLIAIVIGFVFYRRRQQRSAKTDDTESKDKNTENEEPKATKKPGDDLKKDPQGHNISISALAAGTVNSDRSGDGSETMVDKDGRVVPRNPQSFVHTLSGGLRNPQYQSGVYLPSGTTTMYQNNPQYFEPGTQFPDMQHYPIAAASPQLYASSPYPMGVSGGVQSQDFSYPPVPPLAIMRRDSQARMMSGITGNNGLVGNPGGSAAVPMTEEILQLQIALVKVQQDQQFQLQQQNLVRFRAEQEAQLQMLQQQLRMPASSSSPSMATNAISAPVPTVSPLMSGASASPSSSVSAPIPTVGSEPPSSPLSLSLSAATTAVVDAISKTNAPMMDYVPAPVFAPAPSSNATSAATTFVVSAPVSTVTTASVSTVSTPDDTPVKPSSTVSVPVVTSLAPST